MRREGGREEAGADISHFRPHGVKSSFRSGSVKDDLFIREDVMIKYNIPSIPSIPSTAESVEAAERLQSTPWQPPVAQTFPRRTTQPSTTFRPPSLHLPGKEEIPK